MSIKRLGVLSGRGHAMNKSEQKAFKWLVEQGNFPTAINFNSRRTPDFRLLNGVGFEVKRLYKNKILIRADQLNVIKNDPTITILVMAEDKNEPVAKILSTELSSKMAINGNGISIHVVEETPIIRVSNQMRTTLDTIKERNGHTSMDSVIRYLLAKAGET